jgi:hypothetical protein
MRNPINTTYGKKNNPYPIFKKYIDTHVLYKVVKIKKSYCVFYIKIYMIMLNLDLAARLRLYFYGWYGNLTLLNYCFWSFFVFVCEGLQIASENIEGRGQKQIFLLTRHFSSKFWLYSFSRKSVCSLLVRQDESNNYKIQIDHFYDWVTLTTSLMDSDS